MPAGTSAPWGRVMKLISYGGQEVKGQGHTGLKVDLEA